MDTILRGIPGVICYIDDILVTGENEDHLKKRKEVLTWLEKNRFRLNKGKCLFLEKVVEYLGHQINSGGISALPSKVKAIKNAPTPRNV